MPVVITTVSVPLYKSAHVIIDDQAGGHILPSHVDWSGDMADICSRAADSTGFVFKGLKVGSVTLTATQVGNPTVSTTLTVTVTNDGVTGLEVEQG